MRYRIRQSVVVAAMVVLLAGLGVIQPPAAIADNIYGVAESRASWTNPDTGTVHTFHWRFSVGYFAPQWRYRSLTWCDYKLAGSSTVTAESCNFNMFQSVLQVKGCVPDDDCPISEPWGRANWEKDGVTQKLWLGGYHDRPYGAVSVRSATYAMQARFLIPDHVTNWYVGCSKWVDYHTFFEWQMPC